MGIIGHVMVTFKLGKQSFTHKISRFLDSLGGPFILGEDYLSKKLHAHGVGWKTREQSYI